MEGSSQTSSRQSNPLVTKVKALLMRAWRERWNEVQWGIQLKRVMSTTPGDNKDLAGNTGLWKYRLVRLVHFIQDKLKISIYLSIDKYKCIKLIQFCSLYYIF